MTKPRWDQPELMPLRYDYQLLRDSFESESQRSKSVNVYRLLVGAILFCVGFVGLFNSIQ